MTKLKLSNLSFCLIVSSLMNSLLLGILYPFLIKTSKTSLFTALVFSYFIGLLILFLYSKIFNYLPSFGLFDKISYVFSKVTSKIIYVFLSIIIYFLSVIILWRVTTFISTEFLVDTPTIFICIMICIPIIYSLFFDYDTLGRIATIFVFFGIIMFTFNILSLSSSFDIENLKPILNNDFIHLSVSSIIFAFSYFAPLFLTLVIPKNSIINNSKTTKYLFLTYTINTIFSGIVLFAILSILGVKVSSLYTYPSYVVLKNINVLNFIKNVENVGIIILLIFMTFTLTFLFMMLKDLLMKVFNLTIKKASIINIIFTIIPVTSVIMISLPYESYINKIEISYISSILYVIFIIISLSILILGKIKRK